MGTITQREKPDRFQKPVRFIQQHNKWVNNLLS